jgi:hypothetical protein
MQKLVKLAAAAACVLMSALPAAAQAPAQTLARPTAPAALQPPAGQELVLRAAAVGVQIYRCDSGSAGPAWTLVAPEAVLLDGSGRVIGTHFGGPTWAARDGSRVVGARTEGADAANPDSVPWLLLHATQHDGNGLFANVANVQRLYTAGGNPPPAAECTAARAGTTARVDYTAFYYFYRAPSARAEARDRAAAGDARRSRAAAALGPRAGRRRIDGR